MSAEPLSALEKIANIKERERRDELRKQTEALLVENGIAVKTPEQRAADEIARREAKAAKATQPSYNYTPGPKSVADVLDHCGPYADTVAAFATASCARSWACDGLTHKGQATGNPSVVIQFAMDLHIAQIWRDAGISNDRLVLDNLSTESRCEVALVVAQTLAEWEAAGSPGLDIAAVKAALRYLNGHIWMGELAAYPGSTPIPQGFVFAGIIPNPHSKDEHCPS